MANPQVQEFKKNLILQAAYKCFKANSFIEVTMDDIAAEAGFSKATLYQFFESKDAILFYILKENLETVCTEFQSIIDEMYDPCAALDKILNMSYRGFRDNSQLIISFIHRREASARSMEWVQEIGKLLHKKNQLIAAVLQAGMNEGVIVQQDPMILAQILDDMIRGTCMPSLTRSFSLGEEEMSKINSVILNGITIKK